MEALRNRMKLNDQQHPGILKHPIENNKLQEKEVESSSKHEGHVMFSQLQTSDANIQLQLNSGIFSCHL